MSRDRETKAKLLESARQEFIEKGYMKASLRNICKNAGVTTGALYFFFDSKEDLFDAIVGTVLRGILEKMEEHFEEEKKLTENGKLFRQDAEEFFGHVEMSGQIVHQMYLYREEFQLVLTKSQGSKYENIKEQFISLTERHCRLIKEAMDRQNPGVQVEDSFIHWLAHEQVEIFIHMISHIETEEKAQSFMRQSVKYMLAGWYGMYRQEKNITMQ